MKMQRPESKRVLVFGDFDILHPGHLHFLREARHTGDALSVVVTRTSVIKKIKGHTPLFSDSHRLAVIKSLSLVGHAMLGDTAAGSFRVIEKVRPDVICVGYDQNELEQALRSWLRTHKWNIRIARIPAYNPKTYKSDHLKNFIEGEDCLKCRI